MPSASAAKTASFDWAAPATTKSFDDMPIPTAAAAAKSSIGFTQIAQRSKGSSICFGGEPVNYIGAPNTGSNIQWGSE